jgi:hypothetical protein
MSMAEEEGIDDEVEEDLPVISLEEFNAKLKSFVKTALSVVIESYR